MEDIVLDITKEKIFSSLTGTVMHEWEHPIMKKMAEWVCQNGGDIIEMGFGMGISATYIQQQNINSHTICEINPQILKKLHEWAKNKPNVIILEGDWYDNLNKMSKYNGIFFDTHMDKHSKDFEYIIPNIAYSNCSITWWNNYSTPHNRYKTFETTKFETLEVNPPQNTYFNHKQYYMPKYTYNA